MPGAAALGSLPQSQAVLEPSGIGSPTRANVTWPSGVLQVFAWASVTFGMAPMSAYRATPSRSLTIVFTQGMPWYFCRIDSTCWVVVARSMPNQVLTARGRLPALTSPKANPCEVPQGSEMPDRLLNIGPYLVHQNVWCTGARLPSGCLAMIVTRRGVIATALPSCRYSVGWPGTRASWNGVNRNAVDTVWLHATDALWPMRISGTPYSDAPVTLILPGMVSCDWKKRSVPIHGKCGLPSSRPRWSLVPAEPIATALLPMLPMLPRWARCAAASARP